MKEKKGLNYKWLYKANVQINDDEINSLEGYKEVDLPHTNIILPYNYFNEKDYQFISCYKKRLRVLPSMLRNKKVLRIEGIAHQADIYIDNTHIHHHQGGYDEFCVNLDEYLTELKDYQITIFVDATENKNIPPFGNVVDYLGYGGIYREITLEIYDAVHFEDIFVHSVSPLTSDEVLFDITVTSGDELVIELDGESYEFPITNNQDSYVVNIKNKQLWSIDNPYLYHAHLKLYDGYHITDEADVTFGIRDIKFSADGFYLNGQQLKLRGLNRHQSYPYVGYAMPKRAQEEDAGVLKETLGVNVVRTSHYMQSKHFLNKCDELGLLVLEEMPGWQHIGGAEFKENSYQNIKSMITRDYNHPSIIAWGVRVNESPDCHDFYINTNKLAHRLDDSRPTFGVRNIKHSEFLEDIYTYNDFIHNGTNQALSDKKQVTDLKHPYLVTETNGHMYPTKTFDQESKRLEHALRHLRVIDKSVLTEGLSGVISWAMCDYNTHKDFGSGDLICYHGVLDMFRNPKLASYIYSSQQELTPVLEVLSSMNIGEYDAGVIDDVYIATNLDYVKIYKNDICLGDYYPAKNIYKGVKHPPIIVSDFIGNQLVENEGFSLKDSETAKKLFKMVSKYGENISLKYKLSMLKIMKKYHLTLGDAMNLFFKYYSLWGTANTRYRFVGFKDQKQVLEVIKEEVKSTKYSVKLSSLELVEADTYDTVKVDIFKTDQNNNLLSYSFDSLEVVVSGGISLIGPDHLSLIGGMISFWCRTNGKGDSGQIDIKINNQTITKTVTIQQEKK